VFAQFCLITSKAARRTGNLFGTKRVVLYISSTFVETFEVEINIYGIALEVNLRMHTETCVRDLLVKCWLPAFNQNWNNSTRVFVPAVLVLFHVCPVTDKLIISRSARRSALQGKSNLCKSITSRNVPFQIYIFFIVL
jgi:hypothetical protein